MFCIHCKYTSFDYLPSCPRCGRDWSQEKKTLNLDWLVASAPEGKHQRQVSPGEADASFAETPSGTWSAPVEGTPETNRFAAPASKPLSPYSQDFEDKRGTHQPGDEHQPQIPEDAEFTENELDFPELDELLRPQNPPDTQQPPTSLGTEQTTERPGLDNADSAQLPEQENRDDDLLDLSSLVHDLGLEMDESDDAQNSPDQTEPSKSRGKKSPPSG